MAKFYSPEQWKELSEEDKKAFFSGLWGGYAEGGMIHLKDDPPDPEATNILPNFVQPGYVPEVNKPDPQAVGPTIEAATLANNQQAAAALPTPTATLDSAPTPLGGSGNPDDENRVPRLPKESLNPVASTNANSQVSTKTTTMEPMPGADQVMSGIGEANKRARDAEHASNIVKADEANKEASLAEGFQRDNAEQTAREARAEQVRQAATATEEASIRSQVSALANEKVDPNKFYADRGTAAQIGAAISMAFGAYGAALTGTKNFAAEIIERAIDRDIAAQKENIDVKSKSLGHKENLFQMMRERIKDDRVAEAATRMNMRQDAINQFKALNARTAATNFSNTSKLSEAQLDSKQLMDNVTVGKALYGQTVNEKTVTQLPKYNAMMDNKESLAEVQKISDGANSVHSLTDLYNRANSDPSLFGRVSGLKNKFSNIVFNEQDPRYLDTKNQNALNALKAAKPIFGRVSQYEIGRLESLYPNMWDSAENFKSAIGTQINAATEAHQRAYKQLELAGVSPALLNTVKIPTSDAMAQGKR